MRAATIQRCAGLYTGTGRMSVPEGALVTADDVMIVRPDVIQPRLGFSRVLSIGRAAAGAYRPQKIVPYDTDFVVVGDTGAAYRFDRGLVDSQYTVPGVATPRDETVAIHSFAEARKNLYMTTGSGLVVLHDKTDAGFTYAGLNLIPWLYAGLNTSNATPMTAIGNLAYRVVWKSTDANGYVRRSIPSPRFVVRNAVATTASVLLYVWLSPQMAAGDELEFYRTSFVSGADAIPSEEYFLSASHTLTSAEVSAQVVTAIDDDTDDASLGAALYTNPSREGILAAKEIPPVSGALANFGGCLWQGNTKSRQTVTVTLGRVAYSTDDPDGLFFDTFTGDFTNTSAVITNVTGISDWNALYAGQFITDATHPSNVGTNVPANTVISSWDSGAATITMNQAATDTNATVTIDAGDIVTVDGVKFWAEEFGKTSGFDEHGLTGYTFDERRFSVSTNTDRAKRSEFTAITLAYAINAYAAGQGWGYRASVNEVSFLSAGPGEIVIESLRPGAASFLVICTKLSAFVSMGPNGTTSTMDTRPHRIYYSAPDEPEAVPSLNYIDFGDELRNVLAMVPLRDALIVFADDGIWRVTGVAPDGWSVDVLDSTQTLLHPDAVCTLDDVCYALTDAGIVRITEMGVDVISGPIEDKVRERARLLTPFVSRASYRGFYAVAHRQLGLVCFALGAANSQTAAEWYVYHARTGGTWTRWTRTDRCAAWDYAASGGAIITGAALTGDWGLEITKGLAAGFDGSSGTTVGDSPLITLSCTVASQVVTIATADFVAPWSPPVAGDALYIGATYHLVTAVATVGADYKLTVDGTPSGSSCTWVRSYKCLLQWAPVSLGLHVGTTWREIAVHLQVPSDFDQMATGPTVYLGGGAHERALAYSSSTLTAATLTNTRPVRMLVPRSVCRASQFHPSMYVQQAVSSWYLFGLSLTLTSEKQRVIR